MWTIFIILFILKLVGVITISWWWVFSPIWLPLILYVILGMIIWKMK